MICDNCGCSNVRQRDLKGFIVAECQVCGYLHGNADEIAKIEEMREAEAVGVGQRIYSLQKTMQKIPYLKMMRTHEGSPPERIPPYISFTISDGNQSGLEILLESLNKINRKTKIRWMVEVTYQKMLTFSLKPNFPHDPHYITPHEVTLAQEDLDFIKESVETDLSAEKNKEK